MNGTQLIAEERNRQITEEGWTPGHDEQWKANELGFAARGYLDCGIKLRECRTYPPAFWPWDDVWWKPSEDPVRNLVKAGALIAAEIDRQQGSLKESAIKAETQIVQPMMIQVCPQCLAEYQRLIGTSDTAPATRSDPEPFNLAAYIARQKDWSANTFGQSPRTKGITAHIRKELIEIEAAPCDVSEWMDVVILALDGAWRCGHTPEQIIEALKAKQHTNFQRSYPKPLSPDHPSEHDRTLDPGGSSGH